MEATSRFTINTAISTIGVIIISVACYLYSGQYVISATLMSLYFVGLLLTRIMSEKYVECTKIYSMFFIIYSILLIITQYLFIDHEVNGYFTHNDAVFSFYKTATLDYGAKSWHNLIKSTIMASVFSDYPLFSLWINAWKLLGLDMGVSMENMRMFLRLQNLIFAAGTLTIIANYLKEIGFANKATDKYCIIFGFFSYLYLTSVVYTRDLHVAFFYTLAAYYCLSPKSHGLVYIKLIIIALICFGLRPENGMFAVIFPIYYRFRNSKPSVKLIILGSILFIAVIGLGFLDSFMQAKHHLNERTAEANSGGLYLIFNALPFPLSSLFNALYSFIMPFPLTKYLLDSHVSFIGLPTIIMPVLNLTMLWITYKYIRTHRHNYWFVYFFLIGILFIIMTTTIEPNVRRTFAVMPSLYMLFAYAKPHISNATLDVTVKNVLIILLVLNIPAILYLLSTGKLL